MTATATTLPTTAAVFAAAATATTWTRTNLGPRTDISHDGYTWTVELPTEGHGPARITGRHGYGGTEHLDIPATPGQTIGIVEAAQSALRPTIQDTPALWQAMTDCDPLPYRPTTLAEAKAQAEGFIRAERGDSIIIWRCGGCDTYYTCPDCAADRPVPLRASWWETGFGEYPTNYSVEPIGPAAA